MLWEIAFLALCATKKTGIGNHEVAHHQGQTIESHYTSLQFPVDPKIVKSHYL